MINTKVQVTKVMNRYWDILGRNITNMETLNSTSSEVVYLYFEIFEI